MKREVDLNEISDGRLYSSGDMVKVDCHDCEGCPHAARNGRFHPIGSNGSVEITTWEKREF